MQEIFENKTLVSYLMSLIAAVMKNDSPPEPPINLDFNELYRLARFHGIANIAYYGLVKLNPPPPGDSMNLFQAACHSAVFQEVWHEAEVQNILSLFEEHKIRSMPLKGYVIKHIYPKPDMRTMGDVDILIDGTQTNKARDIMLSLGYTEAPPQSYHDAYYKKNSNIELHHALVSEKTEALYAYFGTGWERARLKIGSRYLYEMSAEDNYVYMLGHMAKHYQENGIGLRYILDIWVYMRYYNNQINWDYVDTELKQAGLYDFNERMKALSEYWFDGKYTDNFDKNIAEYVLANTNTGRVSRALNSLLRGKKNNEGYSLLKLKFVMRVLFPNLQAMAEKFPTLQKAPFLLPVFWAYRGIITFSSKKSLIKLNAGEIGDLTRSEVEKMEQVQRKSGLL